MCMWLKVTRSAQNMGKSKAGLGKITRFNTWVEHIQLTRMIIRSWRLTRCWVLLYRFKIPETTQEKNSKDLKNKLWITWLHRAWNHICRLDKNFAKLWSRRLWRSLSLRVLQKHFWTRRSPWEEYQELQEHCNYLNKISSIDHCCAKVANLVRLICCTSCCHWLLPPLADKLPELILHKATSEQGSQWCVLSNPTAGLPKKNIDKITIAWASTEFNIQSATVQILLLVMLSICYGIPWRGKVSKACAGSSPLLCVPRTPCTYRSRDPSSPYHAAGAP